MEANAKGKAESKEQKAERNEKTQSTQYDTETIARNRMAFTQLSRMRLAQLCETHRRPNALELCAGSLASELRSLGAAKLAGCSTLKLDC